MISGMMHFLDERGYDSLDDFIGVALPNIIPAEELNRDFKILPNFDDKKCIGCGRCYVSCYDAAHQAIDWDEKKRRPGTQRQLRRLPPLPQCMPCTGMHNSGRDQVERRQKAGRCHCEETLRIGQTTLRTYLCEKAVPAGTVFSSLMGSLSR